MIPADTATADPDHGWLRDWLDEQGLQPAEDLTVQRIGHGYSNLTYGLGDGSGRRWVLRRPPPGELLATAHDVVREARIMRALGPTDVPVPQILAVRHDEKDVPWVLMEYVDGQVVDTMSAGRALAPALRPTIGASMAGTLARLHAVDVDRIGLGDLSGRACYASRQLRRWTRQSQDSRTTALPELDQLTDRLTAAVPEQAETGLVHGDFHIKNMIVRHGEVAAVLDWELSTLGDPLADVGTLLAYWPHPGEMTAADRTSVTTLPGYPSRDDLLHEYATVSRRDVSAIGFWHVLGLWKIAIIGEGIRRRVLDQPGAASLAPTPSQDDITSLVHHAHQTADAANL